MMRYARRGLVPARIVRSAMTVMACRPSGQGQALPLLESAGLACQPVCRYSF
ncbi:MAG TPA: hypothetical protein VLR90_22645 [Blastocatellia bacterium]|nr:hypothetical protein [Blastocatellia bacterium]